VGKKCTLVSKEVQVMPSQTPSKPQLQCPQRESAQDSRVGAPKREAAPLRRQQKLTEQEGIRQGDERNYARVQDR